MGILVRQILVISALLPSGIDFNLIDELKKERDQLRRSIGLLQKAITEDEEKLALQVRKDRFIHFALLDLVSSFLPSLTPLHSKNFLP